MVTAVMAATVVVAITAGMVTVMGTVMVVMATREATAAIVDGLVALGHD